MRAAIGSLLLALLAGCEDEHRHAYVWHGPEGADMRADLELAYERAQVIEEYCPWRSHSFEGHIDEAMAQLGYVRVQACCSMVHVLAPAGQEVR